MNKVKFWRIERNLSQHELAAASGIPRWAVQLIEQGYRAPSTSERRAVAKALCVDEDAIFDCRGTHE